MAGKIMTVLKPIQGMADSLPPPPWLTGAEQALQITVVQDVTDGSLRRSGIVRGMQVLDLECGVGDAAMLIAKLVGPSGLIVGVDRSRAARPRSVPRLLATATATATATGRVFYPRSPTCSFRAIHSTWWSSERLSCVMAIPPPCVMAIPPRFADSLPPSDCTDVFWYSRASCRISRPICHLALQLDAIGQDPPFSFNRVIDSATLQRLKMQNSSNRKSIALVAHDAKKLDLIDWAASNRCILAQHTLFSTETTGQSLVDNLGLAVTLLKSGPLGGDQQIGSRICEGKIDFLIFFSDPLQSQPHDCDVKALLRVAVLWNVPVACNRASADFMASSPFMSRAYHRQVPDFSRHRGRLDNGPLPGFPVVAHRVM
jgi:methylglyoxal synthase